METLDEVLKSLNAPESAERRRAVRKLRWYRDSRVIEPLIELLNDPEPGVRASAANSLGKLSHKLSFASWAKQVVESLIALLEDENEEVVASVIYALGQFGESSVGPRLLPFLDYPDMPHVSIRRITIDALCTLCYQPAIPYLHRLLHDPDPGTRSDALLALVSLRHEFDIQVEEILKLFFDDPEPLLRENAREMMKIIANEASSDI